MLRDGNAEDWQLLFPMHSVLGGALFRLRLGLTASSHDTIVGIPNAYCGCLCAQSLRDVFQFLPGKGRRVLQYKGEASRTAPWMMQIGLTMTPAFMPDILKTYNPLELSVRWSSKTFLFFPTKTPKPSGSNCWKAFSTRGFLSVIFLCFRNS